MPKPHQTKKPSAAATFSQRRKQPPPDLKELIKGALIVAAEQLEAYSSIDIWGAAAYDGKHADVYDEAKKIAANYIRMGAR